MLDVLARKGALRMLDVRITKEAIQQGALRTLVGSPVHRGCYGHSMDQEAEVVEDLHNTITETSRWISEVHYGRMRMLRRDRRRKWGRE